MSEGGGTQPISAATIAPANVLDGFQSFAATTAATTIIQVPAGRTWIGWVTVSCVCKSDAAGANTGRATGTISVAGAGSTPANGTVFQVDAMVGANAVGGTTGVGGNNAATIRMVLVAPAGNAIQLQAASQGLGGASSVAVSAIGELQ